MVFSVSKPNPNGFGLTSYTVAREGDMVRITPPDTGSRSPGDRFVMQLKDDQIDMYAAQRQFRIKMSAEGVVVDNPKNDGMRSAGYDMVLQTPLKPEQYQSTGLSVAFGLVGFPLPPHLIDQLTGPSQT